LNHRVFEPARGPRAGWALISRCTQLW